MMAGEGEGVLRGFMAASSRDWRCGRRWRGVRGRAGREREIGDGGERASGVKSVESMRVSWVLRGVWGQVMAVVEEEAAMLWF